MAHHWRVDAWWNYDGAAGDLLGAVLYRPLGLELTHMTDTQLFVLVATIYMAPHCPAPLGLIVGCMFIAASLKGLGWI